MFKFTGEFVAFQIFIVFLIYIIPTLYISSKIKNEKLINLLLLAVTLRMILTFIDGHFIQNILPHSGGDSITFENTAYLLYEGTLNIQNYNWDNYPRLIKYVYDVFGRVPWIIRAINGGVSLLSSYALYRIISSLVNIKYAKRAFLIFLFFPHNLIFSSIILRESLILFFILSSLLSFLKFTVTNEVYHIIVSIVFLLLSSYLHAGTIFVATGYVYYLLTYNNELKERDYIFKKSILFILILITIYLAFNIPSVTRKFSDVSSFEDVINVLVTGTDNSGGSAYLQGYEVSSVLSIIIYSPFKFIYFYLSPMMWDIRNISDLISIIFDSLIYFYLGVRTLYFSKYKIHVSIDKKILNMIIISLLITSFVFSIGTANAGTALRHRFKLLPLLIIVESILAKGKEKGESYEV